jgi:hypothetical protein
MCKGKMGWCPVGLYIAVEAFISSSLSSEMDVRKRDRSAVFVFVYGRSGRVVNIGLKWEGTRKDGWYGALCNSVLDICDCC